MLSVTKQFQYVELAQVEAGTGVASEVLAKIVSLFNLFFMLQQCCKITDK